MNRLQRAAKAKPASDMSALEAIRRRRATRAFTGERIGKDAVAALLDAAVHAPTAMHEEPWAFAIVQDKAVLRRLSDDARDTFIHAAEGDGVRGLHRMSGFTMPDDIFYDAGTLIAIYGRPVGTFVVADCWLAAENLMLAACAMGLGTCVIGLAVPALNTAKWKTALNVPAAMTAYAPIIVGMPRGETPPTSRNAPVVLAWLGQG